jgi:cysteine desulfurase/selenocysteine lyase
MSSTTTTRAAGFAAALEAARASFPLVSDAEAYLDNAATAHKPRAVLDAMTDYYSTANSNVGRGYHRLGHLSTDRFEGARATVAAAIGAAEAAEVVFTAGTTDSVNLLADTLGVELVGVGDAVLVTAAEHNSNLLP